MTNQDSFEHFDSRSLHAFVNLPVEDKSDDVYVTTSTGMSGASNMIQNGATRETNPSPDPENVQTETEIIAQWRRFPTAGNHARDRNGRANGIALSCTDGTGGSARVAARRMRRAGKS